MTDPDASSCLFCRIVAGEIPAHIVHDDELVLAFRDIAPVAPTHILIIPKRHLASAAELTDGDGPLLGRIYSVAAGLARDAGLDQRGYRVVTNAGPESGQSVGHLHFHMLGGRRQSWPPG